jgi:hypothetical protein
MSAMKKWEAVRRLAERYSRDIQDVAGEYAEPGYTNPETAIVTANWNHIPAKVAKAFELLGCEIEWSDEWTTCQECGRMVRTEPDCWHWKPSYVIRNECELLCLECNENS